MKFMKFYHMGNSTVVEIYPDEYIKWQPVTEDEIQYKVKILESISKRIQKNIIIIIDCDKMVHYDKVNYVLLKKMISYVDFPLIVIMKKCNKHIKTLIENLKLCKNITVYFNDVYRI